MAKAHSTARIVQRDGSASIVRRGGSRQLGRDAYHLMLVAPWPAYLAVFVSGFGCFNAAFAWLYLIRPDSIVNARPGSWEDAFFFSVETMATVGYGVMAPGTVYGHVLATIEIVSGMLGVALATGLTFAKFTRPTSRVLFSETVVVAPFDGCPTLMFRAANLRSNQILEARVRLTLVRPETTVEGYAIRRFTDLALVREESPVFALTWTVMHRLDGASPLAGLARGADDRDIELIAVITGIDETFSSTIHSRQSYLASDIDHGRVFVDVIEHGPDGVIRVDYRNFHGTRPAVQIGGVEAPANQLERTIDESA